MKSLKNHFRSLSLVAVTLVGVCCGINAPARAITWNVSGAFNDGGTFSGNFNIDVYGFLNSPPNTSITTAPGSLLTFGQTYSVPGAYVWTYPNAVEFIVPGVLGSQEELYIQFQNPIANLAAIDPITYGFECVGWSCGFPNPDSYTADTRFINFPEAGPSPEAVATPLPSTLTMLIAGFIGLGFLAYRGTKKNVTAFAGA